MLKAYFLSLSSSLFSSLQLGEIPAVVILNIIVELDQARGIKFHINYLHMYGIHLRKQCR
jgi:hypothetical protein